MENRFFAENDTRPLLQNATVISLPILTRDQASIETPFAPLAEGQAGNGTVLARFESPAICQFAPSGF
jgi:hypothetical protein